MRHFQPIMKSEKGFTLVEALVSVFILGFVMVGTIATFVKCNTFVAEVKEHTIANKVLSERIEEIRGMDYDDILVLGTTFTATGMSELSDAAGTLVLEDPFSDTNIRKVTLVLDWTSPQGRAMTKSLAALVTREGVSKQ